VRGLLGGRGWEEGAENLCGCGVEGLVPAGSQITAGKAEWRGVLFDTF
jgi:hypothetical protein